MKKNYRLTSLLLFDILFTIVLLLSLFAVSRYPLQDELRAKSIILFMVYVYLIVFWLIFTKNPTSLFFFFLLYSFVTNAGQIILYIFNIEVSSYVDVIKTYDLRIVLQSIDYQTSATAIMCLFAVFSYYFQQKKERKRLVFSNNKFGEAHEERNVRIIDAIFVISAIVFIYTCVISLRDRINLGYFDYYYNEDKVSVDTLVKCAYHFSMFCSLYYHTKKKNSFRVIILAMDLIIAILLLLIGSRNEIIPMLFGIIFIELQFNKKMTKKRIVLYVVVSVILILVLNALSELRALSLNKLDFQTIVDSLFRKSIIDQFASFLSETGGSLRALIKTMEAVDSGFVQQEQTILYTLSRSIVPTSVLEAVGVAEPVNWSLSTWVTGTYGSTTGWGYSMMAESYFNFGTFGIVYFALFGYAFIWLESKIKRGFLTGNYVLAGIWLYIAAYVIFLARADTCLIATKMRFAFYITFFIIFLRFAFNKKTNLLAFKF